MNDSLADVAVFCVALASFAFVMGMQAPREPQRCAEALQDGRRLVRSGPGPMDCLYERQPASFGKIEDGRIAKARSRMGAVK